MGDGAADRLVAPVGDVLGADEPLVRGGLVAGGSGLAGAGFGRKLSVVRGGVPAGDDAPDPPAGGFAAGRAGAEGAAGAAGALAAPGRPVPPPLASARAAALSAGLTRPRAASAAEGAAPRPDDGAAGAAPAGRGGAAGATGGRAAPDPDEAPPEPGAAADPPDDGAPGGRRSDSGAGGRAAEAGADAGAAALVGPVDAGRAGAPAADVAPPEGVAGRPPVTETEGIEAVGAGLALPGAAGVDPDPVFGPLLAAGPGVLVTVGLEDAVRTRLVDSSPAFAVVAPSLDSEDVTSVASAVIGFAPPPLIC